MKVAIEKITEGVHPFHFEASPELLTLQTDDVRLPKPILVDGTLSVAGGNLVVQARIVTLAEYECSRCLETFSEELTGEMAVLYEQKAESRAAEKARVDESEDVDNLALDAKEIDLTKRVEEALYVAVPMRPLCREDCLGLCPHCGVDLNKQRCGCRTESSDPRWQVLKMKLIEEE